MLLPDSHVKVELTATARAGFHRYTFPATDAGHVVVDLQHGVGNSVTEAQLTIEDDHTASGYRRSDGWGGGKVYFFVMEFSRPFDSAGVAQGDKDLSGKQTSGQETKGHFDFKTRPAGARRPDRVRDRLRHTRQRIAGPRRRRTIRWISVADLPSDALLFLVPSRYVASSDILSAFAWGASSAGSGGGARLVQAICDFVHLRIRFNYQLASPFRTASGALNEGVGVCRDFTHLAVALCRAMNVPARYCTGYLGDIGVPPEPVADGFFRLVRGLPQRPVVSPSTRATTVPRIGRIVMARGRDAADVAISTAFGNAPLARFEVTTYEEPLAA